jgi:uncharacterized membrane protein
MGHIIENIVYPKVDSGILYGIWTPIYGIGCISIILINNFLDRFKFKFYIKIPLLFFTSAIILAIIETIGGYFIEILFGRVFWSYYNHFIPIGKYTSIQMMGLWGCCSIFFIYIIIPIVNNFIYKIPRYITHFLIFIFISDFIYTYSKLANFFPHFFN